MCSKPIKRSACHPLYTYLFPFSQEFAIAPPMVGTATTGTSVAIGS